MKYNAQYEWKLKTVIMAIIPVLLSYIKLQNLAILLILRNCICSQPIKWKKENTI